MLPTHYDRGWRGGDGKKKCCAFPDDGTYWLPGDLGKLRSNSQLSISRLLTIACEAFSKLFFFFCGCASVIVDGRRLSESGLVDFLPSLRGFPSITAAARVSAICLQACYFSTGPQCHLSSTHLVSSKKEGEEAPRKLLRHPDLCLFIFNRSEEHTSELPVTG